MPSDAELGWSVSDQPPPPLPMFDEVSGIKAAIDATSAPFDIFSITNWTTTGHFSKWTTVTLKEVYLFFQSFSTCVL